jgi:integrase
LDRDELGALLVQAGLGDLRDGALITLLALNGLRISEALNATIDDLSTERGHRTLAIVRKGGKHVTIPISPRTGRALDLYIGDRTMGPIFLGVEGGRMDRYCADRMVKRLVKRASINKRISPHSLRPSFITAALDAGVPLRDVQEAASHANPRTTMRYDRARRSLDRHATYIASTFIAGATRPAQRSPTYRRRCRLERARGEDMGVILAALGGQWGRWVIAPWGLERNPSHVLVT